MFTSTRAIGTYKDSMIAGCLDTNGVFLTASKDPSQGQDSFKVIADMNDLFNYPAYHRQDVNGGGGIYQVVEYNGALYVVVCTGTADSKNEKGTLKTFAIVKGTCNGDVTDKDAWTWSVLAGDEKDGAKYPFGLDAERISAGACTLQVYGDYLYIGDYNDVSSALQGFILKKDFTTQATNLEQSINLYRMDKNEKIEKVVGDPTKAFPTSLTGLGSGYTASDNSNTFGTHMNQYTWQTTVYDGKLYVGTMDSTTLLEPIAQLTNGDLLEMDKAEWKSQLNYIRVLLQLMTKKEESGFLREANAPLSVNEAEMTAEEQVTSAIEDAQDTDDSVELSDDQKAEMAAEIEDGKVEEIKEDVASDVEEINETAAEVNELLDSKDTERFATSYNTLCTQYDSVKDKLPDNMKSMYDTLINYATKENIEGLLKSTKYLKTSEAGFDLFEISNKADGSVDVKKVTSNGFGDRFNHGLRIFERTNDYWVIGTANPFNGTQLWRTKSEQIQTETGESKPEENKPDVTVPESKPETNAPETKPETSKPETGTPETKPESKPETGRPNTKPEIKPEMKPEIPNNNMIFQFIGQMMKKVQDFFSGWTQWGFRF